MAIDLTITINTDNAAFDEDPCHELARILRAYAHALESEPTVCTLGKTRLLRDINGNPVGRATWE